jgi:hypothetical protein
MRVNVPLGREEHVLRLITPAGVIFETKPFKNEPEQEVKKCL